MAVYRSIFLVSLILFIAISCDDSGNDGNHIITDLNVKIDQPAGSVIPRVFTGSVEYSISNQVFDNNNSIKFRRI
ncbi:MAG: hypothetical protein JXK07_07900 [Spirochaetes bacterium]|nr:hypothetical protein [Spirochaetota bacterium]MBN2772247.1 hypothetical protein [Spirochaetota bacterium]